MLHRIPLVSKVYKTTQEVIKTIFSADQNTFQEVVLCPFPFTGGRGYIVGLVSRDAPMICSQTVEAELVSVFVPTTPNPTSGFLMMYKREELITVNMSLEEAVKYVVSCGVLVPEKPESEEI